ncbi:Reverse transcriptase (RNA-dependent DNA polymerase) [Candidatus Nitrotoga sp. BS]|uniref:RNA-directed DNA polymerase n=1 Tax=Candidatus Nitrotoga sp. BS TaxID=2890408 RepID=UPI001EF39ACD|nr:RNA-directed DNA polymerase [Candidatus Nitrotoga sp. BS]CAH1188945.1 Reverse transcriptase (RNA-dependent DNA polymerase) [Candidatus Nitrotoga sp. BS]
MPEVTRDHFLRAAADISAHGDNDTLPFDIDTQFTSYKQFELASLAFAFFEQLQNDNEQNSARKISALSVFSERLLAPTGPTGFRVVTKIHPFWNIYFNGLGIAIAEALESNRDGRAHSYRLLLNGGNELFDRTSSWKVFREKTVTDANASSDGTIIVQTDISSFYEHISHHHIENLIDDLFPDNGRIGNQVNALLSKFSSGRSFGLPVGGQCSRILAELFLNLVDHRMTGARIRWHRYVDDYVLIASSHADAYKALAFLSHTLADYGLTLNKTKTVMLTAKHYSDYVTAQLGGNDDEAGKLREIDLRFDPYSDTSVEDYESLKQTVESLQVHRLLNRELEKAIPDTFLVTQIGRTLRLQEPNIAIQLASALLSQGNLHAFRASWSAIMRGIANLRSSEEHSNIFAELDQLLDLIPEHSAHLLQAEAGLLHYLRTLRFARTTQRTAFAHNVYSNTRSDTVRRSCIDCWRQWKDRDAFTFLRNRWNELSAECQRIVWLSASVFGDQGDGFKRQIKPSLGQSWRLGIECQGVTSYATIYQEWCDDAQSCE